MPTFQFEAMDATGQEIKDVIEAATEEEAQNTIRQMGYFVTKISLKKQRKDPIGTGTVQRKGRSFAIGGVSSKQLTAFTRQLSILQDAGLPILRSLRILEGQCRPGRLKNALLDTCDEIEGGSTLSEAMAKSPKVFNRLYVNMIKAGEAGGALEVILRRLAEFMEQAEALKRKVQGAMIYPVVVILVAVGILTFIMIKIVPTFKAIFKDFDADLPVMTDLLIRMSDWIYGNWFLLPAIPVGIWLFITLLRKFREGRMGWDLFVLRVPVFGMLIEKNILARTTRTLGTLVASGVPILEGLNITRETCGNAMFERMYGKVADAIREGETIAKPLKENSIPGFHPVAAGLWVLVFAVPLTTLFFVPALDKMTVTGIVAAAAMVGGIFYFMKMKTRVVDDLVVNMVDVGEETGELDTMLNKVADTFDDEVKVITESLMSLLEPLLIVFLGGAVGFIVIALFLPLVSLIQKLS
jgi:type IV pilus assembly protein PilC